MWFICERQQISHLFKTSSDLQSNVWKAFQASISVKGGRYRWVKRIANGYGLHFWTSCSFLKERPKILLKNNSGASPCTCSGAAYARVHWPLINRMTVEPPFSFICQSLHSMQFNFHFKETPKLVLVPSKSELDYMILQQLEPRGDKTLILSEMQILKMKNLFNSAF